MVGTFGSWRRRAPKSIDWCVTDRITPRTPRVVSWVILALGGVWAIAGVIEAFTADPHNSEGWFGGVLIIVFVAGPLIAVGLGLRSSHRGVAKTTAVASLILAVFVGLVFVAQALDENENHVMSLLVQGSGMAAYLAAFTVELPAFTSRWPSRNSPAPL